MDLRMVKTKKNISEAFLTLRKKYPLEKIKTTELCEIALINKTTFYKHYQDIYALSDEFENELVDVIINNTENIDKLFSDPKLFITGIFNASTPQAKTVRILFDGRMDVLVSKIENRLKDVYASADNSPEKAILISFFIGGAAHLMMSPVYDQELIVDILTNAIRSASKSILQKAK